MRCTLQGADTVCTTNARVAQRAAEGKEAAAVPQMAETPAEGAAEMAEMDVAMAMMAEANMAEAVRVEAAVVAR